MNMFTRPIALIAAGLALSATLAASPAIASGGAGGRLAKPSVAGANMEARRSPDAPRGRGDINVGNDTNVGNKVNVGNDVNIGNDVDIDVDVDHGYGHGYWGHHPVAAGIVIGTVAVTTAAVAGAYYYALPTGCTVIYQGGETYYLCGTVHYRRTWYGNDVVYVVVDL